MGVLYYAVNTQSRKAYELGKGSWYRLYQLHDYGFIRHSDHLLDVITQRVVMALTDDRSDLNPPDMLSYADRIASDLCALSAGGDLQITNDSENDDPTLGCLVVGTRYIEAPR